MSPFANALTDADLFWRRVDRTGDCWIWKGAIDPHGYGRVSVGQEALKAHHVAWLLVMGELPPEPLYRRCPRLQGVPGPKMPADFRACVRPQHMRLGNPEAAVSRWKRDAQSGFPPEFRSAADQFMPTEQAQADLTPLLLYRGNLTTGRAQALFNFTILAQKAEAQRLGDVVELSQRWPDASHAVGLHKPMTAVSTPAQFWMRLIQHPAITDTQPGMRDYIRDTLAASSVRAIPLQPISRYSHWSTRRWRSGRRSMEEIRHAAAARKLTAAEDRRQAALAAAPIPEVWPFIPTKATTEHDLIMAVDAVVPKGLPEWLRQDVCQDLILAVFEEQVTLDNLQDAAPEYIKEVFRMYPGKYGPLSLDAPLNNNSEGKTISLLDTLAGAPVILGGEETMTLAALRDRLAAEETAA